MGQTIETRVDIVDQIAIFSTDRSVTGQDGITFSSPGEAATLAEGVAEFGARLALSVFEADSAVDHVFVASNQVVVRRTDGWPEAVTEGVSSAISRFFRFYDESVTGKDQPSD